LRWPEGKPSYFSSNIPENILAGLSGMIIFWPTILILCTGSEQNIM